MINMFKESRLEKDDEGVAQGRTMVGVKQDDGVVGHLRLVQRLDDITHVLVHVCAQRAT